jgi:hypothetical protein
MAPDSLGIRTTVAVSGSEHDGLCPIVQFSGEPVYQAGEEPRREEYCLREDSRLARRRRKTHAQKHEARRHGLPLYRPLAGELVVTYVENRDNAMHFVGRAGLCEPARLTSTDSSTGARRAPGLHARRREGDHYRLEDTNTRPASRAASSQATTDGRTKASARCSSNSRSTTTWIEDGFAYLPERARTQRVIRELLEACLDGFASVAVESVPEDAVERDDRTARRAGDAGVRALKDGQRKALPKAFFACTTMRPRAFGFVLAIEISSVRCFRRSQVRSDIRRSP